MTHTEAARKFATARDPAQGKPLANNTRLYKAGDDYEIWLHNTPVVTIHANGTYTLESNGWRTRTTKDRINSYSPACVYQRRRVWYIGTVEFRDGMRVDAVGRPIIKRVQQTLFAA